MSRSARPGKDLQARWRKIYNCDRLASWRKPGWRRRMESPDRRPALVWDLPTRLFHWSLVLLVGLNLFLISPRGGLSTVVHFVVGYGIAGLLVFRLFWGFIGSRHSRFSDFVRPWPRLRAYLGRLK